MKKKTLTIAIALVLVVALAVGATWAYLKDSTGPIANTFVAGKLFNNDGGIKLQEKEVTPKEDGTYEIKADAEWKDAGYTYTVQPGVDLPKQPAVRVSGLDTNAYVFVGVKGTAIPGKFDWSVDTAIWEPLMNNGTQVVKGDYTIWKLKGDASGYATNGDFDILTGNQVAVDDEFVPSTLTDANDIEFQAYICQAAGFQSATEAFNQCFGTTTGA